jgi:asparagine synthase (glutamine-hydrolysing)
MCGSVSQKGVSFQEIVRANRLALHRGPDGEGFWIWDGRSDTGEFVDSNSADRYAADGTIVLGHRRLAILDLTDAGLQPMASRDGRVWIVFNGEVFNYIELREELSRFGHRFRTGTDTEVVLAAYDEWGTDCFARFNGMWGLAIIDLRQRKLVLSRDRLGIKPLYVWAMDGEIAFASEIKQLFAISGVKATANMHAVAEYIDTGYEAPLDTFFEGIKTVPTGHWGEVSIDAPRMPRFESYWFPERIAVEKIDRTEARERTRELFERSNRLRLRSDVPVGVCLSGGLDSSAIFGQIQQLGSGNGATISGFSAVFDDPEVDERRFIHKVLEAYNATGHTTLPTPEAFVEECDGFLYHHDEPPGSMSPYAAWSVMRLARQNRVPVLLNGQGGDELFSGYWPAYYLFLKQQLRRHPGTVARHCLGSLLPGGNPALVGMATAYFRRYQHRKRRANRTLLVSNWRSFGITLDNNWATEAQQITPEQYRLRELRQIQLPRLLKYDDRNSMAFGIEGRYPFLDHHLIEWILRLPVEMNLRRGWNKELLRESLGHVLPPDIKRRRSKLGFVTPQATWIRGPLRPVLDEWVARPSARLRQIVDLNAVKRVFAELKSKSSVHFTNESQLLLMRLYFLDRWFELFDVRIPSQESPTRINSRRAQVGGGVN